MSIKKLHPNASLCFMLTSKKDLEIFWNFVENLNNPMLGFDYEIEDSCKEAEEFKGNLLREEL